MIEIILRDLRRVDEIFRIGKTWFFRFKAFFKEWMKYLDLELQVEILSKLMLELNFLITMDFIIIIIRVLINKKLECMIDNLNELHILDLDFIFKIWKIKPP